MRLLLDMSKADAHAKTARLARLVELDPDLLDRYAHELSGGERQRAMLAMALACDPPLLILDEPTSGLDSTTKAAVAETLGRLRRERGLALLVISHDFSLMADLTDDLAVLYGGIVVERGPTPTILTDPRHPYSRDLLGAYPSMTTQKDLRGIRGSAPDPADPPSGCPYHPRCTQAIEECATWPPEFSAVAGRSIACLRGEDAARLPAETIAKELADVGLDQPLVTQYGRYLAGLARGYFGYSFRHRRAVSTMLRERLPWTVLLVGTALVISTILGVALAAFAVWRRGRRRDAVSIGVLTFLESTPPFWIGLLLLIWFGATLKWFPIFGSVSLDRTTGLARVGDIVVHLVLPAATLVLSSVGATFLLARASLLGAVGEDYVLMARAKGLRERTIAVRHALPAASLPSPPASSCESAVWPAEQ